MAHVVIILQCASRQCIQLPDEGGIFGSKYLQYLLPQASSTSSSF